MGFAVSVSILCHHGLSPACDTPTNPLLAPLQSAALKDLIPVVVAEMSLQPIYDSLTRRFDLYRREAVQAWYARCAVNHPVLILATLVVVFYWRS